MALDIPNNKEIFRQRDVRETAVAVKGTFYWSCGGANFMASNPDTDAVSIQNLSYRQADGDNITFLAPANLPDNATITSCIVWGLAAGESWTLSGVSRTGGGRLPMAAATIGTEDTSVDYPIVDNTNYSYEISTSTLDTNDRIYGARITYTL